MSTRVSVGEVAEDVAWVSSCSRIGLAVEATPRDVEATGVEVECFLVARGVLTLGPLEAALPGKGSLEGAVLSMSERERKKIF